MRIIVAIAALSALLPQSAASSEAAAVAFAKLVQVNAVDPLLSSRLTLSKWLSARAKGGRVIWESNDCGEQTGNPSTTPSDFPVCAEAKFFKCDGQPAAVSLMVGTYRRGVQAPADLYWAYTGSGSDVVNHSTLSALGRAAPVCRGAPNNSFNPMPLRGTG